MIFSEATLIPISFVLVISGGVVWLTNLWSKSRNHEERIVKLESAHVALMTQVTASNIDVVRQLSRIEAILESHDRYFRNSIKED